MKALSKLKPEPGIWMTDAPVPEIGHNDVLIKIHRTAICGTDMHIYQWDEWSQNTVPVPMITGHEYSGKIVALGEEVRGFEVGDRVFQLAYEHRADGDAALVEEGITMMTAYLERYATPAGLQGVRR